MTLDELLAAIGDGADLSASLAELDNDALAAMADEVAARFNDLSDSDTYTEDSLATMERLADASDGLRAEADRRDSAAAAAAERVQALAARIHGETDGGADATTDDADTADAATASGDNEDENDPDTEPEGDTPPPPPPPATEQASARRSGVNLAAVRSRTGRPALRRSTGRVSLLAAADVGRGIATGSDLGDLAGVARVAEARFAGFPKGRVPNTRLQASVATISRPFPRDLMQTEDDLSLNEALMERAVDQSRLPGNSLLAAGGWCAPSETVYDLCEPETEDGQVSVPELGIRRGGLRYPVSPLFSDIYAGVGFSQTEAQNIAGDAKDCYEIGCPSFEEVRLDAKGVCITAGILQQRGYPEMVQRVTRGALTAHVHKMNAYTLARMEALSTAVAAAAPGFGAWADTLSAVELQVEDLKYKYRLGDNAVMELVGPRWLRPILRADLAVRNGAPIERISNATLDQHFRESGVNPQWVVDWQDAYVDAGAGLGKAVPNTLWPTTAKVLIYPAGTLVKGVADIISLDAIYDTTNIKTNEYMALFTEEAILVAKRCMESRVLTLTELCAAGRTGAQVTYDCTP